MLDAEYFDGRSTRIHAVRIALDGADLVISGADVALRVPVGDVRVDERLGRAPRRLRLPEGAYCEVRDLAALDALLALTPHVDGRVDRMQRHWPLVLAAALACVALLGGAYRWLLPWAAAAGARHLPPVIATELSLHAMELLDGGLLTPSGLDTARRQALGRAFHALRLPEGGRADGTRLLFRASAPLGANAFTLPDGRIILLDGLVTSVGDDDRILAVLAHELGHAHGRHSLRLLLQGSAVGAFMSFYLGDISQLLAAAPAAVVQARYSQELEAEADDYAAGTLQANGLSPQLLADALERLVRAHPGSPDLGYLSSHPPTDQRIRRLRQLAVRPPAVPAAP